MKKRVFIKFLFVFILVLINTFEVKAGTTISKPKKADPNASIYYKGKVTYYNNSIQNWKKSSASSNALYKYQYKKDMKYYKPIFYLSTLWVANNGRDIEVTIGKSYSRSVTDTVSGEIGVSTTKEKVKYATKISKSYSTTCSYSCSYSTKYIFDMSLYSKKKKYRPAAMGNIMAYYFKKTNNLTNKVSYIGDCYTFNSSSGCDLKMLYK